MTIPIQRNSSVALPLEQHAALPHVGSRIGFRDTLCFAAAPANKGICQRFTEWLSSIWNSLFSCCGNKKHEDVEEDPVDAPEPPPIEEPRIDYMALAGRDPRVQAAQERARVAEEAFQETERVYAEADAAVSVAERQRETAQTACLTEAEKYRIALAALVPLHQPIVFPEGMPEAERAMHMHNLMLLRQQEFQAFHQHYQAVENLATAWRQAGSAFRQALDRLQQLDEGERGQVPARAQLEAVFREVVNARQLYANSYNQYLQARVQEQANIKAILTNRRVALTDAMDQEANETGRMELRAVAREVQAWDAFVAAWQQDLANYPASREDNLHKLAGHAFRAISLELNSVVSLHCLALNANRNALGQMWQPQRVDPQVGEPMLRAVRRAILHDIGEVNYQGRREEARPALDILENIEPAAVVAARNQFSEAIDLRSAATDRYYEAVRARDVARNRKSQASQTRYEAQTDANRLRGDVAQHLIRAHHRIV